MTKQVRKLIRITVSVILILLSIGFSAANMNKVAINYIVGSSEMYVSVIIFIALCVGGLIGAMFRIPAFHKLKRENSKLSKQLQKNIEKKADLRAIPLQKQA